MEHISELFQFSIRISSNVMISQKSNFYKLFFIKKKKNLLRVLTNSDIHLTGMASMFLATKYEDTYYIPMRHFYQDIGHQNFSMYSNF